MDPKDIYTLKAVKLAIRKTHDKLDEDIKAEIAACRADLKAHGVVYADDSDPLILNAIKLWARSVYAEDMVKAAEYLKRYNALRDCLKMAEGYGWKDGSDE